MRMDQIPLVPRLPERNVWLHHFVKLAHEHQEQMRHDKRANEEIGECVRVAVKHE